MIDAPPPAPYPEIAVRTAADVLDLFRPATRAWFDRRSTSRRRPRPTAGARSPHGRHTLIHAPTGSGKTLAAFLWCLDRLTGRAAGRRRRRQAPQPGVRVLYVSPLKALTYDVERNLRAPLAGIALAAARLQEPLAPVAVGTRTGDTSVRGAPPARSAARRTS